MTAWRIELHPGAGEDYLEALDWYLQRSVLVAQRFQKELAHTLDCIAERPELAAADEEGIRWTKMHRFPHGIFYRMKDAEAVQVLAVAHARRNPGYWRSRID